MADKRRLPDDDDDDDFGLRTPVKKPVEKPKAETKSAKRPRPEPEPEQEAPVKPAPRKTPSGKRAALERPAARTSGAPDPAPESGAGGGNRPVLLGVAGLVVALAIGAGVLLALPADGPPEPVAVHRPAATEAAGPAPAPVAPIKVEGARGATRAVPLGLSTAPVEVGPAGAQPPTAAPLLDKLTELRRRSANHEAIARLLDEYAELVRIDPMALDPMFRDHAAREQREQELLAELQRLGAAIVPALQEMLLELDQRAGQIFLCKALAGMGGPEALASVEHVLAQTKDVALQTTLVRFLPDAPDATAAVARAFGREENPNLRSMLLREYARRLGEDDESGREMFASAALNDPDPNVRAEAITIMGRRGDPRDQGFLRQVIEQDQNLPIRQRAIVSYAETGKEDSLPFLEALARDPGGSLPIRASAVLAIGRIGGDRAVQALDHLGQSDPDQEIRQRAQRMAASIRARQQAEREGAGPIDADEGPSTVPHGPPTRPN